MRYDTGLQHREQWLKQLPHFLLMGPQKSGTTALNQYLRTVLRHPAERAFSHFQFNRKQANEPLRDFEQALAAEPRRIADGWHLRAIFAFLGVDDRFRPDTTLRFNVSGVPRNRAIEWALKRAAPMRPLFQRVVPPRLLSAVGQCMLKRIGFEPEVRARLIEEYRADILALQQRIDRDLSAWLT